MGPEPCPGDELDSICFCTCSAVICCSGWNIGKNSFLDIYVVGKSMSFLLGIPGNCGYSLTPKVYK